MTYQPPKKPIPKRASESENPKPYDFVSFPRERPNLQRPYGHHKYDQNRLHGTLYLTLKVQTSLHVSTGAVVLGSDIGTKISLIKTMVQGVDNKLSIQGSSLNSDAHTILQILGWASRLMRYYKNAGVPVGEIITPTAPVVESARQAEIARVRESQEFKAGDVIEAKVTKISSGNKVTYEILGVIKLTEKEPKKASSLQEGQTVKVKIAALKENGGIKSVKCID